MEQENQMIVIKQGMIHDAVHAQAYQGDILIAQGKIKRIAPVLEGKAVNDAVVIDASKKHVYPGFVEAHCHLGLDGYAIGFEGQDYNEATDSLTPQLSAIDGINPQDPTFHMALQAGITCVATGPGSSNVLGGTFIAIKTVGRRVDDMIVKRAVAMKCAFGENPKRCYKEKDNYSRMTTASKLRIMLERTKEYLARKEAAGEDMAKQPSYDPKLEAMIPVIKGEIPLKAHVHRADDIFTAIRIAKEYGVGLTIDHCTDGSLIADELAAEGFPVAVGPSFGHAGKPELKNKSFETPGVLAKAGCQVSIITDSPVIQQQYLPLCAGLAVKHGMDAFEALKAITIHAAKHIGVGERVGSLEEGKDADILIADGDPLISDTTVEKVLVDGVLVVDLADGI